MIGKIFLVLFALASLSQVCPSPLTKEITADQSPALKFRDILFEIENADPAEIFTSIFGNFEDIYLNLASLMQSRNKPTISEVLDVFNSGLGARLLVVNEKYVQIDPSGVERLLADKVRSTVKGVFPRDPWQQLMINNFLQNDIHRTAQQIRPVLNNRELPLERLTAVFADESLATRATNSTDILASLTALLQSTLCNTVVSAVYTQLNSTLSAANTFLDSITTSSDDVILAIIANFTALGVDIAKQAISYVSELADTFVSNMCSTSSRKRRDLSLFRNVVDQRDTALARVGSQALSVRSFNVIFAVLVSLVVAVITYALIYLLTGGIWSIISLLTSFIFSSITSWVSSIFSSVFSSIFGSVFSIFSWF